ncbi:MAG: SDR family NAD(P)-dependent oxidoreductase [Alphaproteobacteria bacterium]|nr:SDR family NAD(P)-dependent oxidoreductase [Alphaproteobacteria bacterium]
MPTPRYPWKTVWITGASSGIGRELALSLAGAGVNVAASARSVAKLGELTKRQATIEAFPVDVTDRVATAECAARILERFGNIDLAILNAGTWHPAVATDLDSAKAADAMAVNYNGVVNCIVPLLPAMRRHGSGHIAFTGSIAGYRGLPKSSHYGPTKAALINLAETLSIELYREGISITIINPGFVDTPMTAVNDFPMPFLMTARDASARILKKLPRRPFEIAFPWQLVWQLKFAQMLPAVLYIRFIRRITGLAGRASK